MSNFTFIPSTWSTLKETVTKAEQQVFAAPSYTAMLCRKSLEEWVRWIYEHDEELILPFDTSLNALIHDQGFKNLVAPSQFNQINLIRKTGNNAVHGNLKVKPREAMHMLHLLHGFIAWVVQVYSEEKVVVPAFDESLIQELKGKDKGKYELKKLEEAYMQQQDELQKVQEELAAIRLIKEHNISFVPPPIDPNEDFTRKLYIDALLRESGWDPHGTNVAEYPVSHMPRQEGGYGPGKVDYVLWGDNGKPLAVVEAKRTRRDPRVGQHQAKLYADCLEIECEQRPVIFYSNGFNTWIWDDLNYAPRAVFGFYTKDELQALIHRRTLKLPLSDRSINQAITDRPYQHEAIRRVAEALERNQREALLVMATGTGKTRVAASIIDFLSKAYWIKRILFLADRNALIHQAKVNLNDYLPALPAIDLTKEKEDESSRIVFSTYQTIINMIDGEMDGDNRFYGVGHFDLIIFDEIHRSVYNRYKHIFRYFDGLRLGLTATPKSETHRDTYALFGLEPNNPTFAYELEQAVKDRYLVPPRAMAVPIKFQRRGIRYAELSEEEKIRYEEQFVDPITGEFPDEIDADALNEWLFNDDTVDKVIAHLMQFGVKVEGGDKLAKTIVFARSHKHAKFIEVRFNRQFPAYKGDFLKVIDYQEEYKYDLLGKFKIKDKMPQVAVSVDMLDTGIDVPEVCNLVFFKPVRSSTKFWQMIGMGTRLCKDLFSEGEHKKEFIIFDFCGNLEFFNANPKGIEAVNYKTLSQRLFELRLRLAYVLLSSDDTDYREYGQTILNGLIQQTQSLNNDSFIVRQHWEVVEKYQDPNAWNALSELDIHQLFEHIAPLMSETEQDEMAKRFDALMLELQLSMLNNDKKQLMLIQQVIRTAGKLSKKASIPSVAQKMTTIKEVQVKQFWESATIPGIERIRVELRDIIKFLDQEYRQIVFTQFQDEFDGNAEEVPILASPLDLDAYKRKVEQYLIEHRNQLVIYKLRHNIPITQAELDELERMLFEQGDIGRKSDFTTAYGNKPLGRFVRSILGLEVEAAREAFAEILSNQNLNSTQIRFMNKIIDYLSVNGIIEPSRLFEPPFTDIDSKGIGIFDNPTTKRIIMLIDQVNGNAEVA